MSILTPINLKREEIEKISNVMPCHVVEIEKYLKKRGYKIDVYKELRKNKYIVKFKNVTLELSNPREFLEQFKDVILSEKLKQTFEIEKELYLKKIKN